MGIEFTNDQKKAIEAKGAVLVAAAAGSGKTAVLTRRVIERVCDKNDPTTIDRLLIVTFTNASAAEMRVRIAAALDAECAARGNDPYILKQKLLLKSAKICTIDSFCIDLVRKHFAVLSVSPDFKVAAAAQASDLRERAVSDVLLRHFAEPSEDFNRLCTSFNIYKGENDIKNAVFTCYDFSLCLSRPEHWLNTSVDNYFSDNVNACGFAEAVFEYAETKLKSAEDLTEFILRESIGTEFEADWQVAFGDTLDRIAEMKSAAESGDWDRLYMYASSFESAKTPRIKKGGNKELNDLMKDIKQEIKKSIDGIAAKLGGISAEVLAELHSAGKQVKMLVTLVKEFSKRYFELLCSKNLLTFSLVEQLALKLLCDDDGERLVPSEISAEICKLYDEVLVDEYQDNNDLQDSLFNAVSDNGKHLFMVGDVKQSIYGFRNANPDNFLRHKDNYPLYDGSCEKSKIILSENFRSREGVCRFVNGICGALMQKSTCGMDYTDEERLVAKAEYPENSAPAAEIVMTEYASEKKDIADAEAIADYIVGVMREPPFLRDADNSLRKAEYGDFAILHRSPSKRLPTYIDALKKRGIPVAVGGGDFYGSPEVLTAMSVLRIIDNPTLDIPLLSAMTSAVFGFDFDEVAKIKSAYKGRSLYARVLAAAEHGDRKVGRMLDTLSALRTEAVTLSVSRLISRMYNVTGFSEMISASENGGLKRQKLMQLISMAEEFEGWSDGGLSGFIGYFDRSADEGSSGDKSLPGKSDAVRIMSFHGSKGLQFPVCIIAGVGVDFNDTDLKKPLIVNGKYGIGIDYVEDGIKHETIAKNALKLSQLNKNSAEELRLFYVAMTRAEERLMISVATQNAEKDITDAAKRLGLSAADSGLVPSDRVVGAAGLKQWLLSAALLQRSGDKIADAASVEPIGFNGDGDFKFTLSHPNDKSEPNGDGCVGETEEYSCSDAVREQLDTRFGYRYPFELEIATPSKMAVTELVHGDRDSFAFRARPRFMSKSGLTPAERGTALHKFMQFANYSAAATDVEAEISRLYEWEFITEAEAESIDRKALKMFFESDVYRRITSADKVLREYKFMIRQAISNGSTIVQGIADCIFFEGKKAVILDFKTDNVKALASLAERYAAQLKIYKEGVSEIFGTEQIECIIYSMHLSASVEV